MRLGIDVDEVCRVMVGTSGRRSAWRMAPRPFTSMSYEYIANDGIDEPCSRSPGQDSQEYLSGRPSTPT